MQMVKGDLQADMLTEDHAIAKDVAAHISDPNNTEILGLGIVTKFPEMALNRFPTAFSRNAHLFMVIASRPARCKGVPQPETIVLRYRIGKI